MPRVRHVRPFAAAHAPLPPTRIQRAEAAMALAQAGLIPQEEVLRALDWEFPADTLQDWDPPGTWQFRCEHCDAFTRNIRADDRRRHDRRKLTVRCHGRQQTVTITQAAFEADARPLQNWVDEQLTFLRNPDSPRRTTLPYEVEAIRARWAPASPQVHSPIEQSALQDLNLENLAPRLDYYRKLVTGMKIELLYLPDDEYWALCTHLQNTTRGGHGFRLRGRQLVREEEEVEWRSITVLPVSRMIRPPMAALDISSRPLVYHTPQGVALELWPPDEPRIVDPPPLPAPSVPELLGSRKIYLEKKK